MKLTRKRIIGTVLSMFAISVMATSCGEGTESIDGAALAQEMCECTTKANALASDDPNRRAEQDKCTELKMANWNKIAGDKDQEKAWNDQLPCGM